MIVILIVFAMGASVGVLAGYRLGREHRQDDEGVSDGWISEHTYDEGRRGR